MATTVPAPSEAGIMGKLIGKGYLPCDMGELEVIENPVHNYYSKEKLPWELPGRGSSARRNES